MYLLNNLFIYFILPKDFDTAALNALHANYVKKKKIRS